MNTRKVSLTVLIVVVAFLLSACGASGTPIPPTVPPTETSIPPTTTPVPPIIYVSTPEIEIIGAYMVTDLDQLDSPESITNVFLSGITELTFAIKLQRLPSELSFEIYTNDALLEIPGGVWLTATSNITGESTVSRSVESPTGVFVDGAYQTKVYINGELVVLLNWFVGE